MKAYRASLLYFGGADAGEALYEQDGLLVVGKDAQGTQVVKAIGSYQGLHQAYQHLPVEHFPGRLIAPGFVDMHLHYPQLDVIGSPADGLLPWLENYTFPLEKRFAEPEYCTQAATFFIAELLRNGVTTALAFATSHAGSVDALLDEAQKHSLRLMAGKVLMDQNAPEGVRDETGQSLADTEALINKWHGVDRLGYAITPRFVPSCSEAQLRGAGELAAKYPDVWIQSHVAENRDEIAWVRQLYPQARSYLRVYEQFGLLRPRAVYAHCIHIDDDDRAGFLYGLASDGGGTSFSPFHTMLAAYYVGREGQTKTGVSLSPQQLWWQHTAGAARALGLEGVVGNLLPGCEADFVVLNLQATPLLASRAAQAASLDELLFALIVLGDDRVIERTVISQALSNATPSIALSM